MRLVARQAPLRLVAAVLACLVGVALDRPDHLLAYTILGLPILLSLTVGWLVRALPFAGRWAFFFAYPVVVSLVKEYEATPTGYVLLLGIALIPALLAGALVGRRKA